MKHFCVYISTLISVTELALYIILSWQNYHLHVIIFEYYFILIHFMSNTRLVLCSNANVMSCVNLSAENDQ